ncbi:GGDEF domain-containing protein [Devosia algicola]|uniref:GGDEF domain-containing protein n=1 Tax=Devosia algicola TaxID=3026418 RepID=A0ABY7YJW9_9HYPH|nr:GGDEF domain-containing protein [Devosia algicola]WDR01260.1 GGDEF domain-containing protein [Devosia algicola]
MIDVDLFKQANDSFGHAAGDAVIIEVARRIAAAIGPGNYCGRWGGDEFIVLLSEGATNRLQAGAYAVMAAVCDTPIALPDGKSISVTISVGACLVEPDEAIEHATDMADTALYMAKGEGRSRVVMFDPNTALPQFAPKTRA